MKKHLHDHLDKLHPMGSFGVVSGITQQVRVTRLENRLNPAVAFPHKHSFYHLVFITAGKGWHEIDFKRYDVKPGAFFFMRPAQVHSWSMSKSTTGIVVEFVSLSMYSSEELLVLTEAVRPSIDYCLTSSQQKNDFMNLVCSMLKEYEEQNKDFETVLRMDLAKLIVLFSRNVVVSPIKLSKVSKFREDFHELVEKNFRNHHSVEFYAAQTGLSTKSLTAKVNRIIGKNVRDMIQERCILESKRLLAYSDMSVSEIAFYLGYEDPNYFTRFFKLKTKTNPGKFRQKVRAFC